jgi:glycosyltransferase involved in cell wall biosynthesis
VRRVLVLAYYFPPLGGAGVQRTVKLLKHLPALGYEPVVVTGPSDASIAWAPPDTTLADELPTGLVVRRVAGPTPAPPGRWSARASRWLDRPDRVGAWWSRSAERLGLGVEGIDLVYATMSPFETAAAARAIAVRRGVPWVADLRDPWALDEWTVYPTAIHRRRDLRRMRAALRGAAEVIANTPEAERVIAARFPELAPRLSVVPNGWDAADFAATGRARAVARADGAFRIVYVGYSHLDAGSRHRRTRVLRRVAGGATRGLDILSRSHTYLLQAIELLRERRPELAARIEVHLAGPSPAGAPGTMGVTHHGYLDHAESVALLRSADLLFLPMHDLPPGVRARTVPGKTYEYLASGRPILAALPDGDARDLLAGLDGARVCRPRDVACLAEGIRSAMTAPADVDRVPAVAQAFERKRLAGQIAAIFDRAIARASCAPA